MSTKVTRVAPPPNLVNKCKEAIARLHREPPAKRINMAFDLMEQLTQVMAEVASARRAGVRELRAEGWTLAAIAAEAGISPSRVKQIEDPRQTESPEERAAKRAARAADKERFEQERVDAAVRAALEDAGR